MNTRPSALWGGGWSMLAAVLAVVSAACSPTGTTVVEVHGIAADLSIVVAGGGTDQVGANSLTLEVGESASLSASATNAIGLVVADVGGTWSSSDAGVASVTSGGVVTGVSVGTADITVATQGLTATLPVDVVEAAPAPTS